MGVAVSRASEARSRVIDSLRPPALGLRDRWGQATRHKRALPALLLAGGQRCGTTSMYKALVQQPHLHRPVWRKGVHYFDVAYDRGPEWYRSHFPLQSTLRRSESTHDARALTFESSPYYLFHPLAAQRIHETVPDAKVVVLVRDPIERAFSAHAHELARGYETLPFAEALAAEHERLDGEEERLRRDTTYESHAHRHQAYRSRGEYVTQLEHLAAVIGRERIKVVDSHRFFSTPDEVFTDLLGWLGTRAVAPTTFDRHNARPRGALDPALHAELEAHFAPYDERLADWLGRPPSWRE